MTTLGLILLTGIPLGVTYALVGYAFTVTYRSSGVFNFGIGQVTILGALIYISIAGHLNLWIAMLLAALANAVFGVAVYFGLLRLPERAGAGAISLIMITLGLGVVLQNLVPTLWGYYALQAPVLLRGVTVAGSIHVEHQRLVLIVIAAVVLAAVYYFERSTMLGKALIATGVDREAAVLSGVDDRVIQAIAWSISFAVTGLAGILFTPLTSASMNNAGVLAVNGFSAALIGGLGNSSGAVVGGLAMGIVAALVGVLVSVQYADAITFALVIAFILLRPAGLLGDVRLLLGPRA
jgi:branched-chain amino acid transport system permease protein